MKARTKAKPRVTQLTHAFGVAVTRKDGSEFLAWSKEASTALFWNRPSAKEYSKELSKHVGSCRVVKIVAAYKETK